jgi:peptidoglycan/LPS O-acetylase OafA/YrhL
LELIRFSPKPRRGEVKVTGSRLVFANQLRGLAALSVIVSHFAGVFWGMRDFIGLSTSSPPIEGVTPAVVVLLSNPWFNYGPFGVGIFFLLSGLVIPLSLGRHTRASFMAARLLRIYPTYLVALLIEMAVLHASSAYWHRPFPFSNWQIAENALLIHTALGQPVIDLVNWTLCIEMKFYLLMTLFAPQVRAGRVLPLFCVAGIIFTSHLAVAWRLLGVALPTAPGFWQASSYEALFLIFMFIGVLFSFHQRRQLSTAGLLVSITAMFTIFSACWPLSSIGSQFPVAWFNYGYAVMLFSILYCLRSYARAFPPLDFFAEISFPLYLVHAMVGFSLMKWLMISLHLHYAFAVLITFASVVLLAAVLHRTVEIRTMALGRQLSN